MTRATDDDQRTKQFVLVVDDEEHITELLAMGLGFNGFEVERASNGRAALAAIDTRRPDLLILDVMMPDLGGFEVAKRLRQQERADKRIPIIFLTARDATVDKVEGLRLGADDYVTKPFSIEELIEREALAGEFGVGELGGEMEGAEGVGAGEREDGGEIKSKIKRKSMSRMGGRKFTSCS